MIFSNTYFASAKSLQAAIGAVLGCLFVFAIDLPAQTPQFMINPGTFTTSTNTFPFSSTTQVQLNYTAGQFVGAYSGLITKVYFKRAAANSAGSTYSNFTLKMAQIASSAFPSTTTYYTPMTTIYTGLLTVPAGAIDQWFAITLPIPVPYDANQALMFQPCNTSIVGGFTLRTYSATAPPYRRIYGGTCGTTTGTSDAYLYDCGLDLASPYYNDAGISSLLSPVSFCTGSFPIQVQLKNFGLNNLISATIKWTYDGVPQPNVPWTGTLAPQANASITLGTQNFAAGVPHTLKVWTTLPNNINPDSGAANDTLTANLKPALSGTFTIGGASPTYTTFAAAVADINANGICGPVIFNVRPGMYNEQVMINSVNGASATNTITFQAEPPNTSTNVILSYTAGSSTMHTLALSGADYVTVKNITIEALGATYAQALVVQGGSDYNTFENCVIRTNPTTTASSNICAIYSPSGSIDNYNTFRNNQILNGSYGVYWYGGTSSSLEESTLWEGNTFSGAYYYYKLYTYYQNNAKYIGNTITNTSTYSGAYMMYLYYNLGATQIVGNKIFSPATSSTRYGVYLYCGGVTNPVTSVPLVANNFFALTGGSTTTYGLYLYYLSQGKVYNNTVFTSSTYSSSRAAYIYYGDNNKVRNNIFYNSGIGYAHYVAPNTTVVTESDYNLLYTTGTYVGYWSATNCTNLAAFQAASGKDANSKSKIATFANESLGDLHLAGASQNDFELTGVLVPEVTDDIDGDPRVVPYMGADEACYILPGTISFDLVDAAGNPVLYANAPGTFYLKYAVSFPSMAANIAITLKFIDAYTNTVIWQTVVNAVKQDGVPLVGQQMVTIPGTVPPGTYRVEATFYTKNSCDAYINYPGGAMAFLVVPQGTVPCEVWPGDVNNNGVVNYGDRSSLNKYIHDANLNPLWLTGPKRYRPDAATNPFTYYTWTAQLSSAWNTPEGCYADCDGNGNINNLDHIAIKFNWMRTHGSPTPKGNSSLAATSFDMSQNYPNPFNPSTTLEYSVPEASNVHLVVTDMLGREVATLVNGNVEAGVHRVQFDASAFESGIYYATVKMVGSESGTSFTRSVKMTLAK